MIAKGQIKDPLLELALLNAIQEPAKVSAVDFALRLNVSPMTASRRLKELEGEGYIARTLGSGSSAVIVTQKGAEILKERYLAYKSVFEAAPIIKLAGSIVAGLGEGRYYLSIRGYTKQFEHQLGFSPYPGTLNVKLDLESASSRKRLDSREYIYITSFRSNNRTFGGIKCYRATISGIEGAVIIPDRSHYRNDIIETIAPVSIKNTLHQDNGDPVEVVVT